MWPGRSLQPLDHHRRVALVDLEDLEPGHKQRLYLRVVNIRDEGVLDQVVDRLVVGKLVFGIALVERSTAGLPSGEEAKPKKLAARQ